MDNKVNQAINEPLIEKEQESKPGGLEWIFMLS